ncbi:hypothetical protein [Cupriavidus metallidurans]|uniref:hypothetical protein n=1 Tax=Cupriavidus metallidurans TaxID=119219 RepID=UPI000CE06761|nr:hypothetical protein [Cupriavidus metallidurans]AVA36293.1 hypothetical protein C3Z06_23555 [Cupriavidus metallidurans]
MKRIVGVTDLTRDRLAPYREAKHKSIALPADARIAAQVERFYKPVSRMAAGEIRGDFTASNSSLYDLIRVESEGVALTLWQSRITNGKKGTEYSSVKIRYHLDRWDLATGKRLSTEILRLPNGGENREGQRMHWAIREGHSPLRLFLEEESIVAKMEAKQ